MEENFWEILKKPAKEFMTAKPFYLFEKDPIEWAIDGLVKYRIGSIIIVNERYQPIDIITESDAMEILQEGLLKMSIGEVLKILKGEERKLYTVRENTPLKDILAIFTAHDIKHLPVVNEKGELVGIISASDVLKKFVQTAGV